MKIYLCTHSKWMHILYMNLHVRMCTHTNWHGKRMLDNFLLISILCFMQSISFNMKLCDGLDQLAYRFHDLLKKNTLLMSIPCTLRVSTQRYLQWDCPLQTSIYSNVLHISDLLFYLWITHGVHWPLYSHMEASLECEDFKCSVITD